MIESAAGRRLCGNLSLQLAPRMGRFAHCLMGFVASAAAMARFCGMLGLRSIYGPA
jgi:hypothetical protein